MKNSKKYRAFLKRQRKISRYGMYLGTKCLDCGNNLFLFDRFDAKCCIVCDIWTERNCGDSNCPYCSVRPSTPSEAFFSEKPHYDSYRKDNLRMKYQQRHSGKIKHENSERNLK